MLFNFNTDIVDLVLVIVANVFNLLTAGIFLARVNVRRARAPGGMEHRLGLGIIALLAPLLWGIVINALAARPGWFYVLPSLLLAFIILELLLDYVWALPFRETRALGPYLLLYYVGLNAMIGYAFLVGTLHGAVTLVTYFISLAASLYSYRRVGHGT